MDYDAVVMLSFGGPEGPDDVMPFLRNVTRGRNVPDQRLAVVAKQYQLFDGRSPINDHCRQLKSALEDALTASGIDLPVYWGNRNWHPFLSDTVAEMAQDGIKNALVYVTSAFGSYSGCRQYQQDMQAARQTVGPQAPQLSKLRLFYNHPGFIAAQADRLNTALDGCGLMRSGVPDLGPGWTVLFTAHSLPVAQATVCDYVDQLHEAARLVVDEAQLGDIPYEVVYQSRSGPPSVPWLEPDINDRLTQLGKTTTGIVAVPLGFVSDHAEVLFDLDTQARATAEGLGLDYLRVPTVGHHPRFVQMIVELITERIKAAQSGVEGPRLALGSMGPWPDQCPADHCLTRRGGQTPP